MSSIINFRKSFADVRQEKGKNASLKAELTQKEQALIEAEKRRENSEKKARRASKGEQRKSQRLSQLESVEQRAIEREKEFYDLEKRVKEIEEEAKEERLRAEALSLQLDEVKSERDNACARVQKSEAEVKRLEGDLKALKEVHAEKLEYLEEVEYELKLLIQQYEDNTKQRDAEAKRLTVEQAALDKVKTELVALVKENNELREMIQNFTKLIDQRESDSKEQDGARTEGNKEKDGDLSHESGSNVESAETDESESAVKK